MDLVQRLRLGDGGFLLFGITPPKAATGPDDLRRIAESTLSRLRALDPDGVVLYDILEERDRNPRSRPFPFLPTLDQPTTSPTTWRAGANRRSSTGPSASTPNPSSKHGCGASRPIGSRQCWSGRHRANSRA